MSALNAYLDAMGRFGSQFDEDMFAGMAVAFQEYPNDINLMKLAGLVSDYDELGEEWAANQFHNMVSGLSTVEQVRKELLHEARFHHIKQHMEECDHYLEKDDINDINITLTEHES